MGKRSNRIPSALKYGIYSGIGPLPTENTAKFRKFKKQIFAELIIVGPLEEDIGNDIVCLEWRRKNLFTYDLAQRARERHSSIYAQMIPPTPEYMPPLLSIPGCVEPEPPTPEELAARRVAADEEAKTELGDAIELVKLGNVVTYASLENRLAILERLDAMIIRAYKKLLYVRGIKTIAPSAPGALSPPLLKKPA